MNLREYNQSVDLYADRVYRFIIQSTGDEAFTQDIVQDAYAKLWEKHKEVDAEKSRSWLFTTAYRIMIDEIRRGKKMERQAEHHPEPQHERQWTDVQEVLHEALQMLPDIQKQVVLLRDYEGYSYDEISEMCELSISQVKVYIFRARKKLKTHLGSIEHLI